MYKIVRTYYGKPEHNKFYGEVVHCGARRRTIETGLTLEEAQAHCNDPETSSRTCTSAAKRRITRKHGEWFDGYTES